MNPALAVRARAFTSMTTHVSGDNARQFRAADCAPREVIVDQQRNNNVRLQRSKKSKARPDVVFGDPARTLSDAELEFLDFLADQAIVAWLNRGSEAV